MHGPSFLWYSSIGQYNGSITGIVSGRAEQSLVYLNDIWFWRSIYHVAFRGRLRTHWLTEAWMAFIGFILHVTLMFRDIPLAQFYIAHLMFKCTLKLSYWLMYLLEIVAVMLFVAIWIGIFVNFDVLNRFVADIRKVYCLYMTLHSSNFLLHLRIVILVEYLNFMNRC